MHIVGRNWLVWPRAHPRVDGLAKTLLLELVDQGRQPALLFDQVVHDRDHAGPDDPSEQTIKHSHASSPEPYRNTPLAVRSSRLAVRVVTINRDLALSLTV